MPGTWGRNGEKNLIGRENLGVVTSFIYSLSFRFFSVLLRIKRSDCFVEEVEFKGPTSLILSYKSRATFFNVKENSHYRSTHFSGWLGKLEGILFWFCHWVFLSV